MFCLTSHPVFCLKCSNVHPGMVRPRYRGLRLRPQMTLKLLWTPYCNYYHGLVSLWSHSLEKLWTTDTVLGSLGSALAAGTRCGQAETRDQSRPGAAYNGQTWPVRPAQPAQDNSKTRAGGGAHHSTWHYSIPSSSSWVHKPQPGPLTNKCREGERHFMQLHPRLFHSITPGPAVLTRHRRWNERLARH